jgi:hypothetical protein
LADAQVELADSTLPQERGLRQDEVRRGTKN